MSGNWLRLTMKRTIMTHYGELAAATFKASARWLNKFTDEYNMGLRKKSNVKHLSVEEREPKCKRWHASV